MKSKLAIVAAAAVVTQAYAAEPEATDLPMVQVTATRQAEPVDDVPASISVIGGDELRRRGANDLRTALGLVAGVEGTPGGDAGPAGAVPAIWGLREADAYLLVVDGVPWGGAFNPATPSLDLTGVERIEILRGAAPVMFGATSFSGVIHVIHYAAGKTPATASFSGGSYGSYGAALTAALPKLGGYSQSLTANVEKRGDAADRSDFHRYHALYRGAADLGAARFHVDGDVSVLPQKPNGNLLLRDGGTLHTELPVNANYNPDGNKLNQERYHLVTGLDGDAGLGHWATTLAFTRTLDNINRGFLRGNVFANPPDDGVGDGLQADGYSQKRGVTDVYFDAHVDTHPLSNFNLTYGIDYLHGRGAEHAVNYGYCIDASGHEYACAGAHGQDEIVRSDDTRHFLGLYAQTDWTPSELIDVIAGLRLNHTRESATGTALDNTGAVTFDGSDSRHNTRLSGVLGTSFHVWKQGRDELTLYADYRNSYKPLAVDFGPEAEVQVLKPETADSYEAGAKTQLLDGRVDVDASVFRMDFRNSLTYQDDGTGNIVRANGGKLRFQGFEIESRVELVEHLRLAAHYAYHDARFVHFTRDNGASADGNRVEMSPYQTGGLGLIYAAPQGFNASLVADYAGPRKLNKSNTVKAGGYTTLDAALGYDFGRWALHLNGYNLSNRRDPVAESELQESVTVTHTAGYYRLPARSVMAGVSFKLD
ncbi:MAG: TonB-dependent receptor [Nevskiaceae bacterium]|nr:MAG: TonB-dependent receptor [Nevskiaceae bacterium]